MAGANNAQMKARGWKAADITKQRAVSGKLSDAVMRAAGHTPKKHSHAAKDIGAEKKAAAPKGWGSHLGAGDKAAARDARAAFVAGKARRGDLTRRGLRAVTTAMLANRKAAAAPKDWRAEALRGLSNKLRDASARRQAWDGPLVHLQGVGKTPGKKAGDLKVGDTMVWNGGATSKVVSVERLSQRFVRVGESSGDGKVFYRKMGADRLVAHDPR